MTTGIILIAAILILGGVIATVGDRIGTRVGKARLSLFKLRPRKTAVLVTILTGSIISASTLAILFAADERLRTGVFELERIQRDLDNRRKQVETTTQQLEATRQQKERAETELQQARAEQKEQQRQAQIRQAQAQKRLQAINRSLQAVITKQTQTQAQLSRTQIKQTQTNAQLNRTQERLSEIASQFEKAQNLLKTVSQQAKTLRAEIQKLQDERQQLSVELETVRSQIAQRDRSIAKLDSEIEQRDRELIQRDKVIAQRATRLKALETQQKFLEQEVAKLEGYYEDFQVLRQGNVALERGRVLAAGVVRIQQPKAARQAVEQLLREANRNAIELTQPGTNPGDELVVQVAKSSVEQVISQIDDGRDYVVRIVSAGNYLLGERIVQAFIDVTLNQVVFPTGDVLAAIPADPATMSPEEMRQRVELLLNAARFRARRAGIIGDTILISDGRVETLLSFIEQLREYNQAVEIKAVAAQNIYTAGPPQVELVAVRNGQVVFGTKRLVGEQLRDAVKPMPSLGGQGGLGGSK
ncbi:DUF3084 domain-containing protein [Aliterella atlantica]|uniref:DUF3084 domain-containing protein n=1 Tax=Aliterella atlantica TaxID=1827278 RepID=UPI000907FA2A|nr:DUF3084 domain-containing protein [Aliterella atlantica]